MCLETPTTEIEALSVTDRISWEDQTRSQNIRQAAGQKQKTHTGPEVWRVKFWVVLILHGIIDAIALPHQVVVSAQDCGVHFGHV